MEHIGIDVHKNQSQICILTSDGELIEKRIRTTRERFRAVLGQREQAETQRSTARAREQTETGPRAAPEGARNGSIGASTMRVKSALD